MHVSISEMFKTLNCARRAH